MPRVSVSYRRDDSSAAARAIYERLRSRYGADSVFIDIDAVELGEDYRKRIYRAISQTDCLLVIMGPRWLGPTEGGHYRINDANDPVRLEVERALEMGLRVVPILLEGTEMPSPDDLPKSLGELAYLNAGDISTGREFDNQIERITRFIDRVFEEAAARSAPKPVAQAAASRAAAPSPSPIFPTRLVAIAATAAVVVLAAIGSSWALLHRAPSHPVIASKASIPTSASSTSGGPGALAISYVSGNVGIVRGDQGSPVAAVRNAPLLPGDALVTGKNSYAELHLGRGTRLFLDSGTQVRVVRAGDVGSEVQLAQGTAEMHVFKANGAQVDTQLAAVIGRTPGVYALSVVGDPTVTVTALAGEATLETQSGEQALSAVRTVEFSGSTAANSVMNQQNSPVALTTGFTSFATTRSTAIAPAFNDAAAAPAQQDGQPLPPYAVPAPAQDIDGTEDLAPYGKWENTDNGQAWVPNEPPQWTPYSNGQWVWEPYYGYTWVGSEPWGWAPYHYGSWAFQPGIGWMWVPGAAGPWAPARVAFVQSAGFVAWVPLGPGDPFAPWWGPSRSVVYITNVTHYHNWHAPRAFTQVSVRQFQQGNFHHVTTVAYGNLRRPTVVNVTRVVPPTRANLGFTPAQIKSVATFPQHAPFVGHPVAVQRMPFAPIRTVHPVTAAVHPQSGHVANFGAIPVHSAPQARPQYSRVVNTPAQHSAYGPPRVTTQYGPSQQRATTTYGPTQQRTTVYGPAPRAYAPTRTQNYQQPAQAQTYQRQGQPYQRPAQTQTYQRQTVPQQTQNYQRQTVPQQTQTYQRPAQTYQRPVQTYERPAQTYQRPMQTYERPAQTYQRPTPSPTLRPRY